MTAPRQLLGWTVPEHIWFGGLYERQIRCNQIACGLMCEIKGDTEEEVRSAVGSFLRHHAHGATVERLPGVLPETPEPPKAGVSETVSRIATLMAQDSEERTADQTAELMQLKATLDEVIAIRDDVNEIVQDQTKRWGMCEMNKLAELLHLRGYRKAVPAPQSSPAPLLPLSAPVETEGQVEGRTEALSPQPEVELKLWNLLDKAEQEFDASDEPCDHKSALVRAVLAEGWRPPLSKSSSCPCGHWGACDHNLDQPSPLPADEVEPDALQWGYREHPAEDVDPVREEYARFRAADDHLTLVQREVRYGPWIAVPVEPKETK